MCDTLGVCVTPLTCRHCGAVDAPVLGPGSGPHAARASCGHCGRFVQWLRKEVRLVGSVNRCLLIGTISKYGVEVRYAPSGAPCASLTLVLVEQGQDGREHLTLVPCEVWGKKAEAVAALDPGALVLFEGKLVRRKKGEQWDFVVSGFDVTPLTAPLTTLTGSAN